MRVGDGIGNETLTLRFGASEVPQDLCIEVDTDGDTLIGCDDPDCWARCTPFCPPHTSCPADVPRCGDGTCSRVESTRLCPDCL